MRIATCARLFSWCILPYCGCHTVTTDRASTILAVELSQVDYDRPGSNITFHTTWRFVLEPSLVSDGGSKIVAYEYSEDHIVQRVVGKSQSNDFLTRMDDIGFKPFDFAKVASLQYKKLAAEADKKGEVCLLPQNVMSFDCRLDYRWKNVDFTLNEYSVGSVIGLYAKYSDDITRLEKLLDLFWDECGVSPFLIERDDEPPNHSTEPTAHRNVRQRKM